MIRFPHITLRHAPAPYQTCLCGSRGRSSRSRPMRPLELGASGAFRRDCVAVRQSLVGHSGRLKPAVSTMGIKAPLAAQRYRKPQAALVGESSLTQQQIRFPADALSRSAKLFQRPVLNLADAFFADPQE